MGDFRFAEPQWGRLIWLLLPTVGLLLWLEFRSGAALDRFLSRNMQLRLARVVPRGRRITALGCLALAGCFAIAALMRPQWGVTYHAMPKVGAEIMVCLDVSKSMLAEDTAPNRLERAKVEMTDLLHYLDGEQVGLIAFAGSAKVLCPLTPDFGFFKMILDEAGPQSVGLGSTRLEEPIRKALAGFRGEGELSRIILLITDGEDHDSLPLEAAREAAERGVKILTIGLGDENGSQIMITDPATGVKKPLRDSEGNVVVSRLDGETLRQIALETDGAYIPAGTGMLDLKSIYDAHIAPLLHGKMDSDKGREVRGEAFQWMLLPALLMLIVGVAIGNAPGRVASNGKNHSAWARSLVVAAVVVMFLLLAGRAEAQTTGPPEELIPPPSADELVQPMPTDGRPVPADGTAAPEKPAEPEIPDDPREAFNQALPLIETDGDRAETLLRAARAQAETDGQVRYRASFNLGWVEIHRAEALLKEKPQEALAHLRTAADWFREAVRLEPESPEARQNLELVMRRVLQLADALARQDQKAIQERLDALIARERGLLAQNRDVLQAEAELAEPMSDSVRRAALQGLAQDQRQLIGDARDVLETALSQREAILGKPEQQRTPEEQMLAMQLDGVGQFLQRAVQRMGRARSQMRLGEAMRAWHRGNLALNDLKQSRDQLRRPDELLGVLIADATLAAKETARLNQATAVSLDPDSAVPAWLTPEYLTGQQQGITERTQRLAAILRAGADSAAQNPPTGGQADPQVELFIKAIQAAAPLVEQGANDFRQAEQLLAEAKPAEAQPKQIEGIAALSEAMEYFLDFKKLLEVTYRNEVLLQKLMEPIDPSGAQAPPIPPSDEDESAPTRLADAAQLTEAWPILAPGQQKNLNRAARLADLLKEEMRQELAAATAPPAAAQPGPQPAVQPSTTPAGPSPEQLQALKERAATAERLLTEARQAMQRAETIFQQPADEAVRVTEPTLPEPGEPATAPPPAELNDQAAPPQPPQPTSPALEAKQAVDEAVDKLQQLRRLFASASEQLRDAAERQKQLNDQTEQASTLSQQEREQQQKQEEQKQQNQQQQNQQDQQQGDQQQQSQDQQQGGEQQKQDQQQQGSESSSQQQQSGRNESEQRRADQVDSRQEELEQLTEAMSQSLKEQAQKQPQTKPDGSPLSPEQQQQAEQKSEKLEKASELVDQARQQMRQSREELQKEPVQWPEVREHQDEALEKLLEALALIDPTEQKQGDQQQQQQAAQPQQTPQQAEQQLDQARLLQAVRDQEDARRKAQLRLLQLQQMQSPKAPVKKDW